MIFGKKQTLVMIKRVEFGIYLAETMKDAENKVLLPKKQVPADMEVGEIKEIPGLITACAFTGHGFGISPIVGTLLAEIVREEKTTLDLSAFRYDRFKAVI